MTIAPPLSPPSPATRILNVFRLHLVNRSVYIGIPWLIIGGALLVSLIITLLMRYATGETEFPGMAYSWAVVSPLWYMVAAGVLAISSTFPFALGFSITRRDFYLGTALLFVVVSVANALALATLVELEQATGGWWLGTIMFSALWFGGQSWIVNVLGFLVIQLVILFVGAVFAAVYMRWRVLGSVLLWFAVAAVILGGTTIIVLTGSWPQVVSWLTTQSAASLLGWLAVPAVIAAFAGYFVVRRATPKN